ncbi:MAG TPA: hypothetical protein VJT50_02795, partial [Pyrinomonadaceae bacterium]|nr:hypothetical protein [Pyrinomonadaceae bacterium]
LGLCLGIVAPVIGSLLTVIAWVVGTHLHGTLIQRLGTLLLFLTIPLLVFGAHCLDLMDQQDEASRRQKAEVVKLTGRK